MGQNPQRPTPRRPWHRSAVVPLVLVLAITGVLAASLLEGPSPLEALRTAVQEEAPSPGTSELPGDMAVGRQQAPAFDPLDPPDGRVPVPPRHPDENAHFTPPDQTSDAYVSAAVFGEQVLLADVALPWQYWLDPEVTQAVAEDAVHRAVAAWDGVTGSRWATSFQGYRAAGTPVADGHSTIFMEAECAELTTANAYLFTDGGLGVDRYGTRTTQIREADIGICPRVTSIEQLERALRHEVGHVVGLGHLCQPGDACWISAMGQGPHECAIMFWQVRSCQTQLSDGERAAVATLYPTVRRLAGPTAGDTAARAAFAMLGEDPTPLAVVVQEEASPGVVAAAAALAAREGGSLLIGDPAQQRCLGGAATAEASRSLARRGTLVLVGAWPASCDRLAYDWDISLRRVRSGDPVAAAVALALVGGPAEGVVLVDAADGHGPALAAAALAAARHQPVLLVRDGVLGVAGSQWLLDTDVGHAAVVGEAAAAGGSLASQLTAAGAAVAHVDGGDAVATGLQVAGILAEEGGSGIVLAPTDGGPERFAAAVVAAREGAVTLLSGPQVDGRVLDWLAAANPTHGWAVGEEQSLPTSTLAVYGVHVGG